MRRRSLFIVLLVLACLLLSSTGCGKEPRSETYADSLPASNRNGRAWLAYILADSTGDATISQFTESDESYAMLGANCLTRNVIVGVEPGQVNVRMYYVNPSEWSGYRSDAYGVAYYEFFIEDDLTIRLLYSEVELPEEY